MLGLAIYQIFFKGVTFRAVVLLTVLLSSLGSLPDVIVTLRANTWIGVPDIVAITIGDSVVQPIVDMLNWMPGVILISQSCPKGLESSVFAFLAGISNLSLSGSVLTGALITQFAGIDSSEEVCNYEALPWLVLVCQVVMPLIIGSASAFLLPNKPQNEAIE